MLYAIRFALMLDTLRFRYHPLAGCTDYPVYPDFFIQAR